ncbi:sugar 3,4-ketoisomerase [Pontibacter arcticus]|uniref:WxcM-like domain-containing protein n=1 Tax=Pontibacter arcticus TaxID=2080288 RepID=A0A364RH72_9BACT|nr:FdtA/QdtA family cupin domain-containing protein [Pontibacter arcticus]RAU83623.1 WxcM-like domain-containing protein [Pontibacter arcticus]
MPAAPYLLTFHTTGNSPEGFITSTQQAANIPFVIKRVFWTYGTSPEFVRGRHANKQTEEVLVVLTGQVKVETLMAGSAETFILSEPGTGLYLPAMCWVNLYFSESTIALCMASTDYDEKDYIRDLDEFRKIIGL